jgi:hypothetical protein
VKAPDDVHSSAQLREFVRRGQAAQQSVDELIRGVKKLPPWRRCSAEGCTSATRGAFCPRHRDYVVPGPEAAGRGRGLTQAADERTRGRGEASGATLPRGGLRERSDNRTTKSGKQNT